MDPDMNHQKLPSMSYPPPRRAGGNSSSEGGSSPRPAMPSQYISNAGHAKFPTFQPGPSGGHYQAPPPTPPPPPAQAPESRYPSSSARHEEYSRHPPPPVHYSSSFPPISPSAPPSVTMQRPHPADKFGKTITVSNRTNINDPLSWPAPVSSSRAPPPHPTTHHPHAISRPYTSASHVNSSPPRAVTVLRTAPLGRSDAVHFSPSKGGAFLPYRPSRRRLSYSSRMTPPPLPPRSPRAWHAPPPPPQPATEIIDISGDDGGCDVLLKAAESMADDDIEESVAKATEENAANFVRDHHIDTKDQVAKGGIDSKEHAAGRDIDSKGHAAERGIDPEEHAAKRVKDGPREEGKHVNATDGEGAKKEKDEAREDNTKEENLSDEDQGEASRDRDNPAGESISSMEMSDEPKDTAINKVASTSGKATSSTIGVDSNLADDGREVHSQPMAIATKRPRSAGGEIVSVDDDTPKHINISHPHGSSAFHYPADSKRSRFSEDRSDLNNYDYRGEYQPDLSQMNTTGRRSYSLGSAEDRQDQSTAHDGHSRYSCRQHHGSSDYHSYYQQDEHHPGQVLSQVHSHGSHGGINGSWATPGGGSGSGSGSGEYPEPANYLNSRSLSWEVPPGTLSAIGSTLSFGWNTAPGGGSSTTPGVTPIAAGAQGPTSVPTIKSPDGGEENGEDQAADDDSPPSKSPIAMHSNIGPSIKNGSKNDANNEDDVEDDEIPLLPSSGSNLPPRKRALLAPRPSGPSSKLFEPPRPPLQQRSASRDGHGGESRTVEAREPREGSKYSPHTVHYPHERRREPPPPPSSVRPYDHHYHYYHSQAQVRYGDPHHDYHYETSQNGAQNHGGRMEHRSHHYHHNVGREGVYDSTGRYPNYPDSRSSHYHQAPPWGSPPHTSSSHHGHHYHHGHHGLPPHHQHHHETPGGGSSMDGGADSRSFDSSLSRRSFRSLDDLEEPMTSLLYRPSFSWERGLDVPHSSSNHGHLSSHGVSYGGYSGQPYHGGHHGGHSRCPSSGVIQLRDQQKIMKALTMRNEIRTIGNPNSPVGLILLLAMPQDRHCLSETLCIIRNNVEIFTATEEDINAPAPGRKRPIQIGQVGMRCVYCRMCPQRDRVKRATCFPSSMKRIYRAVIDMKLDHFKNCPYVPPGLKARLDQLQAGSTRSTGMTVQYFVKSAQEVGMVDMDEGVCINLKRVGTKLNETADVEEMDRKASQEVVSYPHQQSGQSYHAYPKHKGRHQALQQQDAMKHTTQIAAKSSCVVPYKAAVTETTKCQTRQPVFPKKQYSGRILLTLPEDKSFLSPLRCFLRMHVCAFTATARDIAVRTPTTFSVRVGQVGVGCVHCLSVPPKARSNRAVCFPFTVARIYQSVADIQRFHLGECRMMPPEVRAQFLKLQSESAKGSRGLATRAYWIDSAKKIGLADGSAGMYFCRDPNLPLPSTSSSTEGSGSGSADGDSLDILAQVASNNNASIKNPLVTPEDRPTIAEFLYLVMEQLRPCVFTDADRNKRRSKDVGSIGVECRHCTGKIDGRKFFWSSVSAAESNFVSVHSHMLSCKYIPDSLKVELTRLKALRREQTSKLKTGSQKAFFTRVWARLHGTPAPAPLGSSAKVPQSPRDAKVKARQVHNPRDSHASKGVKIDVPKKKVEARKKTSGTSSTTGGEPLDLHIDKSNDSDEVRALLESKSTLSSMPSADESIIIKHGVNGGASEAVGASSTALVADAVESLDIDVGGSDGELKPGGGSEDAGENITSEGSKESGLTSVALNLSTVSVHCDDEEVKRKI